MVIIRTKIMKRFLRVCIRIMAWTLLAWAHTAQAQVASRITVGVTPTCPYGILACAGAAHEALGTLEGVESVTTVPDSYNCTFEVEMKTAGLPHSDRWKDQFKAVVGEVFVFRGVEITVDGKLSRQGDQLVLHVPGLETPIRVTTLEHKLQWNFRKQAFRQPEPAESTACQQLTAEASKNDAMFVQIVGPFRFEKDIPVIEVREYFRLKR